MKTPIYKFIVTLSKKTLVTGSLWLTVGGFITSLENYVFNLLMGRFLNPSEYGILTSLISISIVISLPSSIIMTTASKFAAQFLATKEHSKITRMLRKFTFYTFIMGMIIIALFFVLNPVLQHFLNIMDSQLIIMTGIIIAIGLISSVNVGISRGLQLFKFITILGLIGATTRLIFGWYFGSLGWVVYGALLANLLSTIIPWGVSFIPVKKYFYEQTKKVFGLRKRILSFSLPAFYVTAASTLFLTSDIILVKHFFSSRETGIYAAVTIMGKAIYYAIAPISTVLFSVISQKFAEGKNLMNELMLSIFFTVLPGLVAIVIYFMFPQLIVKIFFPAFEYSESVHLIGLYGIYMLVYALVSLLMNFFLAVEKHLFSLLSLVAAIIQIVAIIIFHASLSQVIVVSLCSLGALLLVLVWGVIKYYNVAKIGVHKLPTIFYA